jgi:Oxidoreductase family, NAD-binding Rossmann fold/GFO/IDH/MocA C-terminal domain
MTPETLRIGVAGLGGAGASLLPLFEGLVGIELAAAADVRTDVRRSFESVWRRPAHATVAELCHSGEVDAVYVATPSPLHCEHALEALEVGLHVMCEKPLALRPEDCDRMRDAACRAGVALLQGHSKVLEAPVRAMREVIASGRLGEVFQLDSWNFNDWMRRPRLAAEVDTRTGGGVVLRQAPQQVDMARYLIGREPRAVRALTSRRLAGLPTEGSYAALIAFEGGAAATLSFNGYGHLDVGELKEPSRAGMAPRPQPAGPASAEEKYREAGPGAGPLPARSSRSPFCGLTVVSCERGVLRESPAGIYVHTDRGREEIAVKDEIGRAAGLIELRDAVREGRPAFPDAAWAKTTLEVCLAILESSDRDAEIPLPTRSGGAAAAPERGFDDRPEDPSA